MNQREKAQSEKEPFLKRKITFTCSLTSVIGILIAIVIGAFWAFTFGVIIGRGYEPEDAVPGLGKLMPKEEIVEEVPQTVISKEELTFATDLKSKPTLSTEEPAPQLESKKEANSTKPIEFGAPHTPKTETKKVQAKPEPKKEEAKAEAAENVKSDYVLQIIAYRKKDQADDFREKLEGDGFRTKIEKYTSSSGKNTLYRVQVLLRGTEENLDELRDVLAKYKIKDFSIVSKKALK